MMPLSSASRFSGKVSIVLPGLTRLRPDKFDDAPGNALHEHHLTSHAMAPHGQVRRLVAQFRSKFPSVRISFRPWAPGGDGVNADYLLSVKDGTQKARQRGLAKKVARRVLHLLEAKGIQAMPLTREQKARFLMHDSLFPNTDDLGNIES